MEGIALKTWAAGGKAWVGSDAGHGGREISNGGKTLKIEEPSPKPSPMGSIGNSASASEVDSNGTGSLSRRATRGGADLNGSALCHGVLNRLLDTGRELGVRDGMDKGSGLVLFCGVIGASPIGT